MKRPGSLVARLTLWFTASTSVLVLLVTGIPYEFMARTLNHEDWLFMSDKIQTVVHLLKANPDNLAAIKERVEKEWVSREFERAYVKILNVSGQTITATPSFDSLPGTLFTNLPTVKSDKKTEVFESLEPESKRMFKLSSVRTSVDSDPSHDRIIEIALDRSREDELLNTYRSTLWVVLSVTLVITALFGRRIAVRGIKPVLDIAQAAKRIRPTTLHQKINTKNIPAEVAELAETFNEMLDRLNDSFERLTRFSADIAHDLRTPINNLRGELEVTLGRSRTPEEYHNALGSCLEECSRIAHLIDSLLFLARSENPSEELRTEKILLQQEVLRLREFFEASASESGVTLKVDVPHGLQLHADRVLMQRAMGNLISNAIQHTKRGDTITLYAKTDARFVRVSVQDTGSGIPPEDLPKVFDRFYRVDQARSAKSGGTGLGLSIVKSIMTLHKGEVEISSWPGKGTEVILIFPEQPDSRQSHSL